MLQLYSQLNPGDETISSADGARILQKFSSYPGSAIYIGFRGDEAVSTCALVVVPNLTRGGAPYALIENVVTEARHRKRGYGKAVIAQAISAAWKHNCYKIMLLTGSKDPATLTFYGDIGFEQSKVGFQIRHIAPRKG